MSTLIHYFIKLDFCRIRRNILNKYSTENEAEEKASKVSIVVDERKETGKQQS